MAPRPNRLAAFASILLCASAQAAGEAAFALRIERALGEQRARVVEGRPLYGRGERLSGRAEREVTLSGDAELRRAGTVVRGERITYYPQDDEVVAVGAVRVVREGNVFDGPELRLKIDANEGFFAEPTFRLPAYNGSGRAARVDFLGPGRVRLHDATYTTCRPEDPDWYLRSESLALDQQRQEASGRSASLVFMDRTLFAVPWFAFPLGDQRRSGLLAPSFGFTTRSGPEFVLPYYWNIAPNRDFTFYPRVMARRGLQLGGQFRFLEPWTYGDLRFEHTPNDAVTGTGRHFASLQQNFVDVAGWSGLLNLRGVSDDNYFVDYSRSILASSERSLPRDLIAARALGEWTVLVRATRFQNILDARLAPPYERVPQVNANWLRHDLAGFDAEALVDATLFRRPLAASPEGLRLVAYPRLSYPLVRPGWFVVPRVGLHLSSYQLDSDAGQQSSLNRTVPVFSLDAGLVFERPARVFGRDLTQTLEPRLFYARVPYREQGAIPVFDSTVADFNFAQLFSENTFIGNDRIADVNQLTTAIVSRLIDPGSGAQTLRFALGQRMYFSDQRVTMPGTGTRTDRRSDVLLAAAARTSRDTSVDAGLQYSVRDSRLPRLNLLWRYLPPDGRILNAGVRYLRDEIGQLDGSWRWPVSRQWTALGRINYSWLKQRVDPGTGVFSAARPGVIEGVLGLEYAADCWSTRLIAQRFVTAEGRTTSAFFVQLELAGLARIGSDPFDILRRNIPGYRLPNDRPGPSSRFLGYE